MRFCLFEVVRNCVLAGLTLGVTSAASAAFEVILDGEDSEFRIASGNQWVLDKTGRYMGNYRFSAPKGTGSARCAWDIDAIPDGLYNIEFFIDNGDYAENAEFVVEHDGGVTTVTRSQRFRTEGWYSIGSFNFTGAGRVSMRDTWTGEGTKVVADALRINLQGNPAPPLTGSLPPKVTIMVDDLGSYNPAAGQNNFTTQLMNNAPEVSLAIIPGTTYDNQVEAAAVARNMEVILHQPLQFIGQPNLDPADPRRLYTGMTDNQIRNVLDNNLGTLGSAIHGINNHQGSAFSQYQHGMAVVAAHLMTKDIWFLDSRTISDSHGYDEMKKVGMLTAERDLFVDGVFANSPTVAASTAYERIMWVADRAVYAPNYNYVMICHQRNETVNDLIQVVNDLVSSGVQVIPQGLNLHYIVETDFTPPGATVAKEGTWTSTTRDMISHECLDGEALELAAGTAGAVTFSANLPRAGKYHVMSGAPLGANAASNAEAVVTHRFGQATVAVDQSVHRNRWQYLGQFEFGTGAGNATVRLQKAAGAGAAEVLRADGVKFIYAGPESASDVAGWEKF